MGRLCNHFCCSIFLKEIIQTHNYFNSCPWTNVLSMIPERVEFIRDLGLFSHTVISKE
jgi:hypothetical protein